MKPFSTRLDHSSLLTKPSSWNCGTGLPYLMLLLMPIISIAKIPRIPGNFGDCMTRRIRFMTAITPAYAHAFQATGLARHLLGAPHQNFRLPKPKARYSYFPNARSLQHSERGNHYRGWAFYSDGGTRGVYGA